MVRPARFERATFSSGGQDAPESTGAVDSWEGIAQAPGFGGLLSNDDDFQQDTEKAR